MKKPQLINLDYTFSGPFMMKEIEAPYFVNMHHFHEDYELVLVLESTGKRIIGNHIENFKKGDLVLVGPRLPHAWFNDREYYEKEELIARSIVTYLKKDWMEVKAAELSGTPRFEDILEKARRGMKINGKTKQKIISQLRMANTSSGFLRTAAILIVLHELTETEDYELLTDIGFANTFGEHETIRINEVYEYVLKNFSSQIRLEDVADIANMSPNAFCRYFKTRTKKTFSLFVNEIRVGHACKLLQQDEFSISQICYASGFQSVTNFNKFFKRFIKKSPLKYRQDVVGLKL